MAAANLTASNTGVVAANVVTFNTHNCSDGVTIYVTYDNGNGTSATITFSVINPSQHATTAYRYWDSSSMTIAGETFTLSTDGDYRIPLPLALGEEALVATIAYADGDTQRVTIDMQYGG